MCNLSKGIEERGIEKGRINERVALLCNMMKKMKMTLEEAMQMMDIKEEEYPKYRELLNNYRPKA